MSGRHVSATTCDVSHKIPPNSRDFGVGGIRKIKTQHFLRENRSSKLTCHSLVAPSLFCPSQQQSQEALFRSLSFHFSQLLRISIYLSIFYLSSITLFLAQLTIFLCGLCVILLLFPFLLFFCCY